MTSNLGTVTRQLLNESVVWITVMRYLTLEELLLSIAVLSKDTRETVALRISYIHKEWEFIIREDCTQGVTRIPKLGEDLEGGGDYRAAFWIPTQINMVTICIYSHVIYESVAAYLRLFWPDISLNLRLTNFTDEDMGAEKLIELIGYYALREVTLNRCSIFLRPSSCYLISPCKILKAYHTEIKFVRQD